MRHVQATCLLLTDVSSSQVTVELRPGTAVVEESPPTRKSFFLQGSHSNLTMNPMENIHLAISQVAQIGSPRGSGQVGLFCLVQITVQVPYT